MKCKECSKEFIPYKFGDGRQKFCGSNCQYKNWVGENKERAKSIRLKSKLKHREARLRYGLKYYSEHKEELRVKLLAWRRKNKAKVVQQVLLRRYREQGTLGSHTLEQWSDLKNKYRQRCAKCKKKEILTRDHIIPITKGGSNDISNIQPLCRPCNSKKFNHLEVQ